jgi:hypothetical protein
MLNKESITQQLIEQFSGDVRPNVDLAVKEWWMNFRDSGGLRLSEPGYTVFNQFDLIRYEHQLNGFVINASFLILLDKKLTCPYYIKTGKNPKLIMFGSKEAMMLKLYGDIENYLNMLSRQ